MAFLILVEPSNAIEDLRPLIPKLLAEISRSHRRSIMGFVSRHGMARYLPRHHVCQSVTHFPVSGVTHVPGLYLTPV
jgi:hypothetical protein